MKDRVKEIQGLLIKAEHDDGYLSKRDCWALLYEIFTLRKAIEAADEYLFVEVSPASSKILKDIMKGWKNDTEKI